MGDFLATVDMDRNVGAAVPLSVGEAEPPSNKRRLGRGLPPHQMAF